MASIPHGTWHMAVDVDVDLDLDVCVHIPWPSQAAARVYPAIHEAASAVRRRSSPKRRNGRVVLSFSAWVKRRGSLGADRFPTRL